VKQFVFWCLALYGVERIIETFWKRKTIQGKIVAPYTLYILITIHVLIFLRVIFEWTHWENEKHSWTEVLIGLVSVVGATIVRNWSIYTLGMYHSIHIEIRDNHPLITDGPYSFTRNPYYLSNAIEVIGYPLLVGASPGILLSLCLYLPSLVLRLMIEEYALEEKLGDSFRVFKSRVPRILPDLF